MASDEYGEEQFARVAHGLHSVRLDQEFLSLWNEFVSLSPSAFYDTLALDLPGLRIDFWIYPTGVGGATVSLDEPQNELMFSEIAFDFRGKKIDLKEVRVNPRFQNNGIFKVFMRNMLELSEMLEMGALEFHATEVGAYAFARMGGLPSKEGWLELRDKIRKRAEDLPLTEAQRIQIMTLLESDDPKTLWKIVDL